MLEIKKKELIDIISSFVIIIQNRIEPRTGKSIIVIETV